MEKISVVVPVYNVEKYIDKCIMSLINQTYKNIEIILVDDESTDKSGTICDEYAKKYKNVKCVHKKNGGLSDARNNGIENATGEYISFVDSDDFVSNDFIEFMYSNLKKNGCLISACGFCHYYDDGTIKKINFENVESKFSKIDSQKYLNIMGYFNASACNKLFKKELFNDIKFPKGKTSEDLYIIYKLLDKANGIYYSSKIKYFYRQRNGSITKNIKKINTDVIDAARGMCKYYVDKNYKEIIPYGYQTLYFAYIGVYNALLIQNNKKRTEIYNESKKYRKFLTISDMKKSRKIEYFLYSYCIILYNILFRIFNMVRKK